MTFWIVAILVLGGVAALLLQALLKGKDSEVSASMSDLSVYRDQLEEVERDRARGVLSEAEAETVRLEVSRRLLEADKRGAATGDTQQGGKTFALVLIPVVLIGGLGLYSSYGAPGYRDLPMATRLAEIEQAAADRPSQLEAEAGAAGLLPAIAPPDAAFLNLMTELRAVLADRPDDISGLMLLARNEARLGNYAASREAQEHLVTVKGDAATPADLAQTVEVMTFAAGGYISPEAEIYLRRLLSVDPKNGFGRYFLGLFHAQSGRPDRTFPVWQNLLAESNRDAPWVPIILSEMPGIAAAAGVSYQPEQFSGPTPQAMAAADDMSPEERQEMIQGMVEGLSARLAEDGGSPEEWMQLVRALMVLGDEDRARVVYNEAKLVYGESEDAMRVIFRAGISAGLE
ncbi:c-type cytochrome biogenesis protein CcmI [Rhodobacteraceae bacterium]|nr:c-type cytochrome biogenesis protein CcmI [Paracoccaceae bacterium]